MPNNVVICARNVLDESTLSATPTMVTTLPVTNLQIPARGRVARTTSAAAQDIYFTWNGAGNYLSFLHLSRHNLTPGSTWSYILYGTKDWTGDPLITSGNLTVPDSIALGSLDWGVQPLGAGYFDAYLGQRFCTSFFTRTRILSGKITLTDTGNAFGYYEMSRIYGGDGLEFTYNPDSLDFSWDEDTQQSRSAGGSLRSEGKISYRTLDMSIEFVTEAQRVDFSNILRFAGKRKDIFLCGFPSDTGTKLRDYTGIFRYTGSSPKLRMMASRSELSSSFSFAEV